MSTVILLLFCLSVYKFVFEKQIVKVKEEYKTNCYYEKYLEQTGWEDYRKEITILRRQKDLFGYSESSVLADLAVLPEKKDEAVDTQISRACLDIQVFARKRNSGKRMKFCLGCGRKVRKRSPILS